MYELRFNAAVDRSGAQFIIPYIESSLIYDSASCHIDESCSGRFQIKAVEWKVQYFHIKCDKVESRKVAERKTWVIIHRYFLTLGLSPFYR